jgi:hypothetical protein
LFDVLKCAESPQALVLTKLKQRKKINKPDQRDGVLKNNGEKIRRKRRAMYRVKRFKHLVPFPLR